MNKYFSKFLILYSAAITVLYLKLISEKNPNIKLGDSQPFREVITKEILKKEIVYKEPIIQYSKSSKAINIPDVLEEELEEEELISLPENPEQAEAEEKLQEKYHDTSSEKMLAFFEQAIGIDLTPEQEQKALSALRAYDEADITAMADADTAYLDRKLNLKPEQKENVRKAITEFRSEPEEVNQELANTEVQQIDSQNDAYYNQVAPFLDEKQRADLLNMINQGTTFVDE